MAINQKKYNLRIFTLLTCVVVFLFLFMPTHAQTRAANACKKAGECPIGAPCDPDKDAQCLSNDCEESTLSSPVDGEKLWFCDCDEISKVSDSNDCAQRWGGAPEGDDWHCVDGNKASYNLDFCQMDKRPDVVKYPIDPSSPTFFDFLLDPSASVIADELQGIIMAPQPRIRIPGLKFSDPEELKALARTADDGRTYLFIPFLGQYLGAAYRYAIVAGTILVLVMFIIGGLDWVLAKDPEKLTHAKTRFTRGTAGLLLLLGSYMLLYMINPELVEFRSLKIRYVDREEFDGSEATGETKTAVGGICGPAHKAQTLFPGMDGTLYQYVRYSPKYGNTCEVPAKKPKAIILHYTNWPVKTSEAAVVKDWSSAVGSGAICQIIIGRNGIPYQVTEKINEKVICQGGKVGHNWNNGGIGIEIMGRDEKELLANDAQKEAVVKVIKALMAQYGITASNDVNNLFTYSRGGIFSHEQVFRCQFSPGRKSDPGERYMREILDAVGGSYFDWTSDTRCANK